MDQFGQALAPADAKRSSFYLHCAGCGQNGLFASNAGPGTAQWIGSAANPRAHNGLTMYDGLCWSCIERENWPAGWGKR
jgi:hypothetical protein